MFACPLKWYVGKRKIQLQLEMFTGPFPRTRDMFRASEFVFRQAGRSPQDGFASRLYFRIPRSFNDGCYHGSLKKCNAQNIRFGSREL
jgi:hypothetical protein